MGLSYASLYFFHYPESFDCLVSFLGYDLTEWALLSILALVSLFSGWLVKIALTGKTGF
jgi:hypothetical protein